MSEQIEMLLNSKKLNYDRLNNIIPEYIPYDSVEYDTVTIVIDVFDIMKKLFSPMVVDSLKTNKIKDVRLITSEIINIIGHYRHYMASRRAKYTDFYFIYTNKECDRLLNIDSNYRMDFYNKRIRKTIVDYNGINSLIQRNIKLIKTIIARIPHCHWIETNDIDYNIAPYLLFKNEIIDNNNPMIIISNDTMFLQDTLLSDNIMILILASEKSRIVTVDTVYDELSKNLKNIPEFHFGQNLLPFIIALSGDSRYNIKGINRMSYGRSIKYLNKLVDKGEVQDILYTSFKVISNTINNSSLIKNEFKKDIINNYLLTSHFIQENKIYNDSDINYLESQATSNVSKITAKEIKDINERYFSDNPINFEFCFEGEEI